MNEIFHKLYDNKFILVVIVKEVICQLCRKSWERKAVETFKNTFICRIFQQTSYS